MIGVLLFDLLCKDVGECFSFFYKEKFLEEQDFL